MKRRERPSASALTTAVVEDSHERRQLLECREVSGIVATVMRDEIDVDVADEILRTRQRKQWSAGQIADVEKREPAKRQQKSNRPRILVRVAGRSCGAGA